MRSENPPALAPKSLSSPEPLAEGLDDATKQEFSGGRMLADSHSTWILSREAPSRSIVLLLRMEVIGIENCNQCS